MKTNWTPPVMTVLCCGIILVQLWAWLTTPVDSLWTITVIGLAIACIVVRPRRRR